MIKCEKSLTSLSNRTTISFPALEYLPTIERMIETFRLLNISAATPQVNENSLTEQEVVHGINKTISLLDTY